MRTSYLKYVEKELGLEEGTIEISKEFLCLQGCKSKVLVIFNIKIERKEWTQS